MLNNSDTRLYDYCEQHSTPLSTLLHELARETHLKILSPNMLSGELQGQFLAQVSKIVRPRCIVEIGTFTGYSAICLAQGLAPEGRLHTIELQDELAPLVHRYIEKAGLQTRIHTHWGDAREIIPTLPAPFDLVFIDADKEGYATYFDLVIDKMPSGGIILADNVLWKGKVIEENKDKKTGVLDAFNKKIQHDARVENVLLPIRDGIMWIRKL